MLHNKIFVLRQQDNLLTFPVFLKEVRKYVTNYPLITIKLDFGVVRVCCDFHVIGRSVGSLDTPIPLISAGLIFLPCWKE